MKIARIYDEIEKMLEPNQVLVIYGPRQVGKTTLVKNFLARTQLKWRYENGDNTRIQELGSADFETIKEFAKGYDVIAFDEAQRIPNIGMVLKIIVDNIPGIRLIATGSSSFELAGQIGEPLTGRKQTLSLFPISQLELKKTLNNFDLKEKLEQQLIYGNYPKVMTRATNDLKRKMAEEIAHSYLLKDILELEKVKSSKILLDLLRLLAFQIGNEVSLSELAQKVGINTKTVARYLDLFEKSFVLLNVRGYSGNLRDEITQKSKYYFYDNGIRNAIIANFNELPLRNDIGALWENFVFMERLKKRSYEDISANVYFWRTWQQQEVDIVEEREGKLFGYEIKYSDKNTKAPSQWKENYPTASFEVITKENYLDFIA
ncbi:MAG: ATP-binding protein [Candidatus Moraniibacteriota bacterium]